MGEKYLNIKNNCNKNYYYDTYNKKHINNKYNNCYANTLNSILKVSYFLNNLIPVIKGLKIYKILK